MTPAQAAVDADARKAGGKSLGFTVTVGFSGHRDLPAAEDVGPRFEAVFAAIRRVLDLLAAREAAPGETLAAAFGEPWSARLLTGDAPGADRLAIAAWRALAVGRIHALYPYRDPQTGAPMTDEPKRAGAEERATQWRTVSAWTGFDPGGLGLKGDQAHAEVSRWIATHADVVVAYWNGKRGKGLGGTADVVRRALERGTPIVWLKPGRGAVRLFEPRELHRRSEVSDILHAPDDYATPFTDAALASALAHLLAPPQEHAQPNAQAGKDAEVEGRRDYAARDPLAWTGAAALFNPLLDHSAWAAFDSFKRALGDLRGVPPRPAKVDPPDALAQDKSFQDLTMAHEVADGRANRLSAIHRSEQLLLIALAALAVLISAAPNLAPKTWIEPAHVTAALAEFALGLIAVAIRLQAHGARRHRRWSDARRLAERLRAARLTWPLGVDAAAQRQGPSPTWTEWRARAVLRAAGPPSGWIDGETMRARARWGAAAVIGEQVWYHSKERHVGANISSWMEHVESYSFVLLMIALGVFLFGAWVMPLFGYELKPWISGLVLVLSAATPAVAAASLTLETTLGISDSERRGERCAATFGRLLAEFEELDRNGRLTLHGAQRIAVEAAEQLVGDADAWRDQLGARRLRQMG